MTTKICLSDNLDFLLKVENESVDMVYIDPPYLSDANYNLILPSTENESVFDEEAYKDTWVWGKESEECHSMLSGTNTDTQVKYFYGLYDYIQLLKETCKATGDSSSAAYAAHIAVRVALIYDKLKSSGMFVLHHDHTQTDILQTICRFVFGKQNHRNTITFSSTTRNGGRALGRGCDPILVFSKTDKFYCENKIPMSEQDVVRRFPYQDDIGRFKYTDLTAPELSNGPSGKKWKQYDVSRKNRHWAISNVGVPKYLEEKFHILSTTQEKLDLLDQHNLIRHPKTEGTLPSQKIYYNPDKSLLHLNDIIVAKPTQEQKKHTFETQKPEPLLRQLVRAFSPVNGLVMDCYLGGGTTLFAAEEENRRFVGCDNKLGSLRRIMSRYKERYPEKTLTVDGLIETESRMLEWVTKDPKNRFHVERELQIRYFGENLVMLNSSQKADGGIDGRFSLGIDSNGKTLRGIVQVKSGSTSVEQLRAFDGVLKHENAAHGVFIVLDEQKITRAMNDYVKHEYIDILGNKTTRIILISGKDILDRKQTYPFRLSLDLVTQAKTSFGKDKPNTQTFISEVQTSIVDLFV